MNTQQIKSLLEAFVRSHNGQDFQIVYWSDDQLYISDSQKDIENIELFTGTYTVVDINKHTNLDALTVCIYTDHVLEF